MHAIYDKWPDMARKAYNSQIKTVNHNDIDHIVFAGMGGSGAIGDLFASILSGTTTHVSIVKGYLLPKTVNENTLLVCTSVSGNTSETLAVAKTASKTDCKIICFSSGGMLEQFCKDNTIQFRNIPRMLNPRSSFPSYVYSMLKSLEPVLPTSEIEIKRSLDKMDELGKKISTVNLNPTNPSLELAKWMKNIPLVYYPWGLRAAAIRFKNSVQENMKGHAMIEDIIEASHNGIVAWEKRSQIAPIILSGQDDHIMTKKRWKILKEFFRCNKIDYKEVSSGSGGILAKIVNLTYQLDFATIYGAILHKIDPVPVRPIDFMKKRS